MSDESPKSILELATRLAREAGAVALPKLGRSPASRKSDNTLVTDTDREIERRIVEGVRAVYPNHAIVGEEMFETLRRGSNEERNAKRSGAIQDLHLQQSRRYCWVIDPLDGTRNFIAGIPCFSTSIAVLDRGRPSAAVVYEHNLDRLSTAIAGGGCTLGDAPVHVKESSSGLDLLVGVAASKDARSVNIIGRWLSRQGLILRNFGTTAWHLSLLAAGALDAVFCTQCKIWDIAAGTLLVLEAGGMVTDPSGRPVTPFDLSRNPSEELPILAASPGVHRVLLESIAG